MRVEITAGLGVNQSQNVAITNEFGWCLRVVFRLGAVGIEPPLVVGVFVVVASNLLLSGTFWIGLDVGMEKTTAIPHILDRGARSVGDFKRAVLANFGTPEVGLKQ